MPRLLKSGQHCVWKLLGQHLKKSRLCETVLEFATIPLGQNRTSSPLCSQSEDEVENQIDKCHRIARPTQDDGTQSAIVRFISHTFRENVYVNRKKCGNRNIKIKPSLTRKRRKTLTYAFKSSDKKPNVNFFCADIHGNLKLLLNVLINNKAVCPLETSKNFSTCSKNLNGKLWA